MDDIAELRHERALYLRKVYELTGGNSRQPVSMWEVGEQLGFDREKTGSLCQYLEDDGCLAPYAMGGQITVTHKGVKEVEGSQTQTLSTTNHHSTTSNVMIVESIINSQVQQGSPGASQKVTEDDLDWLGTVVAQIEESLAHFELKESVRRELAAELATIQAQVASPRPRRGTIVESLRAMKTIAANAVAGAAGAGILQLIQDAVSRFS